MDKLLSKLTVHINDRIYLKDPESSELGRKIVEGSIDLIDELGFEAFTFKKLAEHIKSTEASVYRYFESKHKLLLYLTSWYWGWMDYRLVFATVNIESPEEKLLRCVQLLTEEIREDGDFKHINEVKLGSIVNCESSKTYLTREVDTENKEGIYTYYKGIVARVSEIILEINPDYKYPHMLVSTIIEGAHHQRYFADHLPGLTDITDGEDAIVSCYKDIVMKAIQKK